MAKNGKLSPRELRTRESIMKAFDTLMCDQRIEKITVSAIAREAAIDRKTFYLHYKSVDELATYKTELLLDRILNVLGERGQGKTMLERTNIILEEINRIVSENLPMYSNIARTVPPDRVLRRIYLAAIQTLQHAGSNPENVLNPQRMTRLQFFIAGAISVYFTWLKSDHSQPIESVSNSIQDSLVLLQNSAPPSQLNGSLDKQGNEVGQPLSANTPPVTFS